MTKIKFLFSGTGLLTVAIALLISVGLISALPSLRIDLTEDDLFSLADGTRNIVSGLEEPIELLFFYSESATSILSRSQKKKTSPPSMAFSQCP